MTVLVCDDCGERYDDLLVIAGEPCPKVACNGTLLVELDRIVSGRGPLA